MDLNLEAVDAPPRAAATAVIVRDGAHVFPGGKVDPHDLSAASRGLLVQPAPDLPARLNETGIESDTAASLYLAAIRETFEESGV